MTPTPASHPRSRPRGVSLVELLVAMVLGLVVVGGVLGIYLSSRQTFRTQESLARLQEGGRFALELIAREIREAGLTPCGSPLTANVLAAPAGQATAWWADTATGFLRGGNSSGQGIVATGSAAANHAAGTDSLLILRPSSDQGLLATVQTHDAVNLRVTLATPSPVDGREIVLMCDSGSSALWQVDTVNARTRELAYSNSPLNCSTALGKVGPACDAPIDKSFAAGSLLAPWAPALWYVGVGADGKRALYRAGITRPSANSNSTAFVLDPEERIPGVHDLQIDYLTRDRDSGGLLANRWVDAAALAGRWNDRATEVAAVRLTLTLRSEAPTGSDGAHLERVFRSVVALRNREP